MKIDTSGLSCPEPVLKTKQAIKDNPSLIEVIVDNTTALQNVTRFLKKQKYNVTSDDLLVRGQK